MASAFQDSHGWIADFRPPFNAFNKRKRIRIPDLKGSTPTVKARAAAFAKRCEDLARALERGPTAKQIQDALDLGIISPEQADEARLGHGVLPPKPEQLTIRRAFDTHPTTVREARNNPDDHSRHVEAVKAFTEFSGIVYLQDLTMTAVQSWIEKLRRDKKKFNTRRHALLGIRRASRMGPTIGLPDPLNGFKLDSDDEPRGIEEVWTFEQLVAAARDFIALEDPRPLAILAMGGFMGLRPTEITRAQVGDVDAKQGTLKIGMRLAKNKASRRELPIPPVCIPWLLAPGKDRPATEPLIHTVYRGRVCALDKQRYPDLIRPFLTKATGLDLPPNYLRKSFATWAIYAELNILHVEAFMGHQSAQIADITAKHYLARLNTRALQPTAKAISDAIEKALTLYSDLPQNS